MAVNLREKILVQLGDITDAQVDAIVNAANSDLVLGAGVAGAIRKRGGPSIQEECDRIGPIQVGGAAITGGGELKARYVIHAASMPLGGRTTGESLKSSVRRSLKVAKDNKLKSIAFPAIGTGVAGFPRDLCAEIMLAEILAHLSQGSTLEKVHLVLFDEPTYEIFKDRLDALVLAEGKGT